MDTAKLLALVLPLGLDTFAVCCALGMAGTGRRQRARISALMVTFEAGMAFVGIGLGATLGERAGAAATYIAVAVLIAIGGHALLADDDDDTARLLAATGWGTLALGVSISLDELAVGFSVGLLRLPALAVITAIALQTVIVTQLGLTVGARLGAHVREGAERLAGLTLLLLGLVLLSGQLLG